MRTGLRGRGLTKLAHRPSTRPTTLPGNKIVTETAAKKISTNGCDGLPESMTRMTASGENLKKGAYTRMEVLNAKTKTRTDFWNVRTTYEAGKLAQITITMRCYGLRILGVSECRWTG